MADDVVDNARPWNLDFETEDDARSRPVEALLGPCDSTAFRAMT